MIDLHQDAYSKEIGEDGAPLWAIQPPPTMLLAGPAHRSRRAPDCRSRSTTAFATFFDAGDPAGLQAAFVDALEHVATRFADDRGGDRLRAVQRAAGRRERSSTPFSHRGRRARARGRARQARDVRAERDAQPARLRAEGRGAVPRRTTRSTRRTSTRSCSRRSDAAREPARPSDLEPSVSARARRGDRLAHAAHDRRVRRRARPARTRISGWASQAAAPRSLPRERRVLGVEGEQPGVVGRVRSRTSRRHLDRAPAGRRVALARARRADRRHVIANEYDLHDRRAAPRDARRRHATDLRARQELTFTCNGTALSAGRAIRRRACRGRVRRLLVAGP